MTYFTQDYTTWRKLYREACAERMHYEARDKRGETVCGFRWDIETLRQIERTYRRLAMVCVIR